MDIDLVIPMVFPSDPVWQRDYELSHGGAAFAAAKNVRWRSWGTEELLVRCVMKYMPWLHRIHLLLASVSQEQRWMSGMAADGNVVVHHHADFIPKEYLPCFASPCIEMFLDRIPGLSEHFIYANDDMFPLSPLDASDFFRPSPDGRLLPCQHFTEKPAPASPNIFQRKCRHQLNMVAAPFGRHYTRTYLKATHSFAPILRSSCEEVWRRHGAEITKWLSPVRRTDRSYNHYIYSLYQHFSGLYVDYVPREQYAGRSARTSALAAVIRDPAAGIVCLNDNEDIGDWERRAAVVRREIGIKIGYQP